MWKGLQTGYGIYAGTGAFKIEHNQHNFFYPLKYKVERADGTKTITYQGTIGFSDAVTRTITFPLTTEVTCCTMGYTNLPAGRYRVTVTDACGATTSKDIELGAISYNPTLRYDRDCEIGRVIFDIGRSVKVEDNSYYDRVYLQKEVENQYGNISWEYVNAANGRSFVDA